MKSPDTNPRITFKEVLELGVAEGTLKRRLIKREWKTVETGTGRNGKPTREILLLSLPADLQLKWAERQRAGAALEAVSETKKFRSSTNSKDDGLSDVTQALSGYTAEERDAWINEALRLNDLVNRYEAIDPKRTRIAGGATLEFVPAVKALCKEAVCTNEVILIALAQRSRREPKDRKAKSASPHTLDEWARKRRRVGLLAFVRSKTIAKKPDDGRLASLTPAAAEWLEARWRRYPIVTQLYEKWEAAAKKNHWKIPSLAWLQRRWRAMPPVVKTALFLGDKRYTDKYKPFLPRTVKDLDALQLLCGDHHVLDVFCWSDQLKRVVRLWLTAWQDLRTGLIWGWHLDYTPSSFTIGCAYANGVRTFGAQPPSREDFQSYIYTDNGKDYRSQNVKGEIEVHQRAAAVNGGLELLLTQRGVGLVNDVDVMQKLARKFNGREKPLERTFKDLADTIQNEFFNSGWCGRNTNAKPDSYRDLYARHVKAMKHGKSSPFLHEAEIRLAVVEWIERYNTKAHTRANLDGATIVPLEEHNRLYTTRFEIRETTLALMVMKSTRGPLRKNGVVALGASYWHEELSRWKGRRAAGNKALELEVRYIDSDYTTAWIVLPDGAICEAQRIALSSMLTPSKESLKAVSERMRSERELIKSHTLLQQSIWRGESVEDRIVAELPIEHEQEMPIAVGESNQRQASVHLFNRLDAKRHPAPVTRLVTAAEVSSVEADEEIFNEARPGTVKEWDDD